MVRIPEIKRCYALYLGPYFDLHRDLYEEAATPVSTNHGSPMGVSRELIVEGNSIMDPNLGFHLLVNAWTPTNLGFHLVISCPRGGRCPRRSCEIRSLLVLLGISHFRYIPFYFSAFLTILFSDDSPPGDNWRRHRGSGWGEGGNHDQLEKVQTLEHKLEQFEHFLIGRGLIGSSWTLKWLRRSNSPKMSSRHRRRRAPYLRRLKTVDPSASKGASLT